MKSVVFVCTGNICRSPTAEGMFIKKVAEEGLSERIFIDSAGTHDYHIGNAPDPRTQSAAKARGYDLSALRARQFEVRDFERFDLVLAMDAANRVFLERLCPASSRPKLKLMMEYARRAGVIDVPDPYYGGPEGFDTVLDLLEDATDGLMVAIKAAQRPAL